MTAFTSHLKTHSLDRGNASNFTANAVDLLQFRREFVEGNDIGAVAEAHFRVAWSHNTRHFDAIETIAATANGGAAAEAGFGGDVAFRGQVGEAGRTATRRGNHRRGAVASQFFGQASAFRKMIST